MPKISAERRTERREQILAGARRCFAEHGYEGATVVRLEKATGLSRGAIFNYFPSKEALFVELAVRDSARMSDIWVSEGLEAVVREVMELDPAWLSVYLELFRRVRNDDDFRLRIAVRQKEAAPANRARIEEAQRTGEFRDDLEPKQVGLFVNLVLNGLALQRASGEELPPVELVLALLGDAIGGRARPGTPSRTTA
ncbi:MAG: TetR/AcrR family transcriptional regulator [Thermoleophilia bacterium]|nr:TetR/AcrR family transcriptional regulator [Thermoleophilia bacterium]MDH4339642.1 TetR/AcrR family transcriptional regulator [Thermoleophilia bacterium]MDH5280532.1 TetR/AcrR family transcriptional regulator [Thermoleophilia bacterium]